MFVCVYVHVSECVWVCVGVCMCMCACVRARAGIVSSPLFKVIKSFKGTSCLIFTSDNFLKKKKRERFPFADII